MIKKHNPVLLPYARKLRREMTKEEKQLWYHFFKDRSAAIQEAEDHWAVCCRFLLRRAAACDRTGRIAAL